METCKAPPSTGTTMTAAFHVVAMPYPGRGHINPMMNLCKLISLKRPDILFTFIVTEEWNTLISSDKKPPNIKLRTIPNVIPSEHVRAQNFQAFIEAVGKNMESPFEAVLDRIFSEGLSVNVIIADTYLDWVVRVGGRRNIPVASLWTMSASVFSIFYHFDLLGQNGHFPIQISERGEEKVDYIPGIPPTRLADFPTMFQGTGLKVMSRALDPVSLVSKAQFLIFTSTYELEPQVIDALKLKFPFPLLNLGPTIPYFELEQNTNNLDNDHNASTYIQWLNSQPKSSVLYVSMGSFLSVSPTQMEEFVAGIFDSGVRCLWVSRGENVARDSEDGDRRVLVVPWCDQMRVLNHPSIGGFWTHCGWNSTLEAVFSGVPILASPIFWDQIPNCKQIVEDWRIGWRVRRGGVEGESLVKRLEIKKMVEDFMDLDSNEVIEMRRRAKELKKICQEATRKGGSSNTNLDLFIKDIS